MVVPCDCSCDNVGVEDCECVVASCDGGCAIADTAASAWVVVDGDRKDCFDSVSAGESFFFTRCWRIRPNKMPRIRDSFIHPRGQRLHN